MSILFDKIAEAKQKIGNEAAEIIAQGYPLEEWNPDKMSAKSIFNKNDNTPSMIWNKKGNYFKDFSTGRVYGLVEFFMDKYEEPYIKAVRRMFDLAKIEYNPKIFTSKNEDHVDFFKNYKYPKEEKQKIDGTAKEYVLKRGISESTMEYVDLRCDRNGNIAFQLRGADGKILGVKYRVGRKLKKDEGKMFWQKDASSCPSLYNMDKIDITKPLLIVEGYWDCLACIESGYTNTVSIPGGAEDDNWIRFNYEWLENFKEIIIWFDNDTAGENGLKKVVSRLGEYRCKIVEPISEDEEAVEKYYQQFNSDIHIRKTDANNCLLGCGPQRVLSLINCAEPPPAKDLSYLMDSESENISDMEKFSTGIKAIDDILYGNIMSCMTIYSGSAGSGKSSLMNTAVVTSAIESGRSVFMYSGELSAGQLLDWISIGLAGVNHVKEVYSDKFERAFYYPTLEAKKIIRSFYHDKIILYTPENELEADSEGILEAMLNSYKRFGTTVFNLDNLMSISFKGNGEDSKWEQQKAFIIKLMNFTNKYNVSVNIAVHPSKGAMTNGMAPSVYSLSGASEISNLTHRMFFVQRDSSVTSGPIGKVKINILKDRPSSAAGNVAEVYYDKRTRRFFTDESELYKEYAWEKSNPKILYSKEDASRLLCNLQRPNLPFDDEPY